MLIFTLKITKPYEQNTNRKLRKLTNDTAEGRADARVDLGAQKIGYPEGPFYTKRPKSPRADSVSRLSRSIGPGPKAVPTTVFPVGPQLEYSNFVPSFFVPARLFCFAR